MYTTWYPFFVPWMAKPMFSCGSLVFNYISNNRCKMFTVAFMYWIFPYILEIPKEIATGNVNIYTYVDDVEIVSQVLGNAQAAFNKVVASAEENDFKLNEGKTVKMTFRRGGKLAANDYIMYKNKAILPLLRIIYTSSHLNLK